MSVNSGMHFGMVCLITHPAILGLYRLYKFIFLNALYTRAVVLKVGCRDLHGSMKHSQGANSFLFCVRNHNVILSNLLYV